jgi:hypothetical protein
VGSGFLVAVDVARAKCARILLVDVAVAVGLRVLIVLVDARCANPSRSAIISGLRVAVEVGRGLLVVVVEA